MAGWLSSPVWTIDYSDDHNWYQRRSTGDQLLIAEGQPGTCENGRGVASFCCACEQRCRLSRTGQSAARHAVVGTRRGGGAWLCGENGSILRFDPTGGTLSAVPTGESRDAVRHLGVF